MANPGTLILSLAAATGGVPARRIVKFGAADGEVAPAAAGDRSRRSARARSSTPPRASSRT